MRRIDASAWGVAALCFALAACSPRSQNQEDSSSGASAADTRQSGARSASPVATTGDRTASDQERSNEVTAAPVAPESPFVERREDGTATYLNAKADAVSAATAPARVSDEILVKFRPNIARARVNNALSRLPRAQAALASRSVPELYRIKLPAGTDVATAIDSYKQLSDVEYAEPNYLLSIGALPNDPRFNELWGLQNIGQFGGFNDVDIDAPEGWNVTTGNTDLVVAVIDTGTDYNHPDLAANMYRNTADCDADGVDDDVNGYVDDCYGIDAVNNDGNPMDDHGHGTHVAGTIGAVGNNAIGVTGVAWNVKIMACKFLAFDGFGSTADAIECLDYIAEMKRSGVNIVATNNSWGGLDNSLALRDAIEAHMNEGILFVAAAGNDWGRDLDLYPKWPCSHSVPNVVCVAAVNRYGQLAAFSNYGKRTVHVGAPGEEILSTLPNNNYGELDGTSMATPHVTGLAVLLKSQDTSRDWRAIKNLLITGSEAPIPNQLLAGSRVNADLSLGCTNRQVVRRLQPADNQTIFRGVGAQIELRATSIRCAGANGSVSVTVSNGGGSVTLLDDGVAPDEIASDGIATGTWAAAQAGQFTLTFPGGDSFAATIDPHLRSGFPVKLPGSAGGYYAGNSVYTAVGNIDSDSQLEILLSGLSAGPLYAIKPDGSRVNGWPISQQWGMAWPVIGNFDNTVGGAKAGAAYSDRNQALFSPSGALRAGWPQSVSYYNARAPIAADLDGDGADEFVDATTRRSDGTSFGLPTTLIPHAVGDLDGDGDLEIATLDANEGTNGHRVRVFHHDGTEAPQYAYTFTDSPFQNLAIGDVDGNGTPEIVAVTQSYPIPKIYLINAWSQRTIDLTDASYYSVGGFALGDLTSDGVPEIVVQTATKIYAVRGSGAALSGWPVSTNSTYQGNSAPVIGDLNGDGAPEVVVATSTYDNGGITAWRTNGAVLAGFPKTIPGIGQSGVPAIADIDGDDANELIVISDAWYGSSVDIDRLWVFDVQQSGNAGPIEWGQHKGSAAHTSFYELGKNETSEAFLSVQLQGAGSVSSSPSGINCGSDCIEAYARNTSVTLTAAASGGTFVGWLGACTGTSTTCTVSMADRRSVVAQFSRQQLTVSINDSTLGSVSSSPSGITCPADCSENFNTNTSVTLTATPTSTAAFASWSGACTGTTNTCVVTMNLAKSVRANFVPKPMLTVTKTGIADGKVTSSPGGIDCGADCNERFVPNTLVTLTATETDDYIVNWSGACAGSYITCTVYMSQDMAVTAHFVPKHTLTVTRTGDASAPAITSSPMGINCGSTCSYRFGENHSVTLSVDNSLFDVEWSGACSGNGWYCSVTMSSALTVSARFTRKPKLTLNKTGNFPVTVDTTPYGIYCPSYCVSAIAYFSKDTTVTLRVDAASQFITWSGGCTGTGTTCTVTMDEAKTVTVDVQPAQFLTIVNNGSGVISSEPFGISCGDVCVGAFAPGTSVTLTATPAPGHDFSGWGGSCGDARTCTITMNTARSITTRFVPQSPLVISRSGAAGSVVSHPAGIDCGSNCAAPFAKGSTIKLTAVPAPGSSFLNWSGACSGSTPTCDLTMSGAPTVVATFVANPLLSVSVSGSGTISSQPLGITCGAQCSATFDLNTIVTLTAVANPNNEFTGWSGSCSGTGATCTLTLDRALGAVASFRAVASSGGGGGGGGGGGSLQWHWLLALALLLVGRRQQRFRN